MNKDLEKYTPTHIARHYSQAVLAQRRENRARFVHLPNKSYALINLWLA